MIKKILPSIFWSMIPVIAFLNIGTIRRNEDPILKTQTGPISYNQKMEETKDGVKGAPAPSFEYYTKEDFLTRTPMKAGTEEAKEKPIEKNQSEAVPEVSNEEVGSVEKVEQGALPGTQEDKPAAVASSEGDWWTEDQAQDSAPK